MCTSLKISLNSCWCFYKSLIAICSLFTHLVGAQNLNGYYRGDNGGHYYVRTVGNTVYWFGEHQNGDWANVFQGTLNDRRNEFEGQYYDVAKGRSYTSARQRFGINTSGDLITRISGPGNFATARRQSLPTSGLPGDRCDGRQVSTIANITACWDGNDGGKYYMSQGTHIGRGEVVVWFGEQSNPDGRPGFANVAIGTRSGNSITLSWVDVPKGTAAGQGTLQLRIDDAGTITRVTQTGGFGGSRWTRGNTASGRTATQVDLSLQFVTGGDDLRGGNDNANVIVLLRNGNLVRFDNINSGIKWGNNSTRVVRRTLPSNTSIEDIAGVRIETTAGGGIGGDNWNLDRLTVTAISGTIERQLFTQAGGPLFRFTGDQRVREFRFSGVTLPPAPAVMTNFNPAVHGFKFVNSFRNIFISALNWTTSGLCGGMSYSALDYFKRGINIPQQNFMPAEGTTLQSYIYNRQVNSIGDNIDKWAEYGTNPGGIRNREFFNWGIQIGSGRLGELQSRIDRGEPVPLGLQECGGDCRCPGGCPKSHQVLAIGYQLGRYYGDLANYAEDVSIFVYDPNFPDRIMTLKPKPVDGWYEYLEDARCRWRSYFVDRKYRPSIPPIIHNNPSEITIEFKTGGDDLRGGNDNVHVVILLRSGEELRFNNINNSNRWIDNSSQTVSRSIPNTITPRDIIGIRLETTFGGGIGGDNWNLDRLVVKTRINGANQDLFSSAGSPLFRFTGSQKTREFRF